MRSGPTERVDRAEAPLRSGPDARVDRDDGLPPANTPRSSEALERGDTLSAEAVRQGRTVLTSPTRRWIFVLGLAGIVIVAVLLIFVY